MLLCIKGICNVSGSINTIGNRVPWNNGKQRDVEPECKPETETEIT